MNARSDISMTEEEVLRYELEVFKVKHRDLDEAITALQEKGTADALNLQRLKREKLALTDRIERIRDALTPDIIA